MRDGAVYRLVCNNQRWELTVPEGDTFDLVLHGEHVGLTWHLLEKSGKFQFLKDAEQSQS